MDIKRAAFQIHGSRAAAATNVEFIAHIRGTAGLVINSNGANVLSQHKPVCGDIDRARGHVERAIGRSAFTENRPAAALHVHRAAINIDLPEPSMTDACLRAGVQHSAGVDGNKTSRSAGIPSHAQFMNGVGDDGTVLNDQCAHAISAPTENQTTAIERRSGPGNQRVTGGIISRTQGEPAAIGVNLPAC